jgi:hypothetical protein
MGVERLDSIVRARTYFVSSYLAREVTNDKNRH